MKVIKDIIREVWHSKIREIYIFVMIFLGISIFVGLNMTNKDIVNKINNYKIEHNLYDLKIFGEIKEKDLENVKKQDLEIEGVFTDYFTIKDTEKVVNISSLNEKISKPILLEGRLPEKDDEIIISNSLNEYKIGDEIELSKKNKYLEQSIKERKLKIVGLFENTEYFSNSVKEIVNMGDSLVNTFILSKESLFNMNEYNLYRIKFNNIRELGFTTDEFKNKLNEDIRELKKDIKDNFYSSILDNTSVVGFKDSIKTMDTLRILFPIVFFMVVILVCSTNLTRMIMDQRRTIGTYKFLGYNNFFIYLKYMLIALLPTVLAIIPGIFMGVYYIPTLIYRAYSADLINELKVLNIEYDYIYISLAIILSIICVFFSVIISLYRVLREEIIELLKGGKEISGNKILLEYVSFLWRRISFKNKITLRNIFRYKKRMIMSIIGISGCASLMFLGFSIKESYSNVVAENKKIRYIDYKVVYYDDYSDIVKKLDENLEYDNLYTINKEVKFKNKEVKNVEIDITNNKNIKGINFIDYYNNDKLELDENGIYITSRLAELLDIKENEYLEIDDKKLKISKILENYIGNYIYTTREYYGLDKDIKDNTLFIIGNIDSNKIYNLDNVISVFDENILIKPIITTVDNLNAIIVLISTMSIILSLVVSLNLMSINISERKKEISTLKVLGFYDYESTLYIYKEILVINIISLFLGFVGGNYLLKNIIDTLRSTSLVMIEKYNYKPFTYTTILIILFTICIGLILDYIISKINMVEALKIDE